MQECLILSLQGVLQAWGRHTYETFRPTEVFPTRSGLTGFLSAALGIARNEEERFRSLDRGYTYAARLDDRFLLDPISGDRWKKAISSSKMMDFHTIQKVRTRGGGVKDTELSRREYLEDCRFTIALRLTAQTEWSLSHLESALRFPKFTLFLGRKSCPLSRPPLQARVSASDLQEALSVPFEGNVFQGLVYSEEPDSAGDCVRLPVRDVPMGNRRFGTRTVYMYTMGRQS